MSSLYMRYSHIFVNDKLLGSYKSPTAFSSTVIVSWKVSLFGSYSEETGDVICRAARINYFCQHSVTINEENKTHMLTNHPKKNVFGKPITVWYNNLYEPHTIVPVQLVKCRSVCLVDEIDREDVFVVIPCIDF